MRAGEDSLPLCQRLSEFLFLYRTTPHSMTDASPAELFLQQKMQTKFDLLKPDQWRLVTSRWPMLKPSNNQVWPQSFPVDSEVMVRDYCHTDQRVLGTIIWKLGPVTYQVDLGKGNIVKRHFDQLTQRLELQSIDLESKETLSIEDYFHNSEHPALPSQ